MNETVVCGHLESHDVVMILFKMVQTFRSVDQTLVVLNGSYWAIHLYDTVPSVKLYFYLFIYLFIIIIFFYFKWNSRALNESYWAADSIKAGS